MKLAVLMDPIHSIHYATDSTLALLWAAQKRGWSLFYLEQTDLFWKNKQVWMRTCPLKVFKNARRWFELGDSQTKSFDNFDFVWMRKDPPVNVEYFYTTYLLEQGEQLSHGKTLVVNHPSTLRDWNEKLAILDFPECIPPTIVTSNKTRLREFWKEQQEIILKPLNAMGGYSIFYVRKTEEPNFNAIVDLLTEGGTRTIMAQRFIPEIRQKGDKRVILINGEPVPYAVARVPISGEILGNISAGGQAKGVPLSRKDRWICSQVGPVLKAKGLWLVGIDIIGDYLIEINITCPSCIRELESFYPLNIGSSLLDALEIHKMSRK